MPSFFENPFREGCLSFDFGETSGATRYETWYSYIHVFQKGKKAVDFIFPSVDSSELFFTEIKDFLTITREGDYRKGEYGLKLANDIAQKFMDSIKGYAMIPKVSTQQEELTFVSSTKSYSKIAVFHWEFNPEFHRQRQLHDMKTMKAKLRELLNDIYSDIRIESIEFNNSKIWAVTRLDNNA